MTVPSKTELLTFELGDQRYCLDIEYVAEIVTAGDVTPVPGTDDVVEGVMDLRGETTRILDPDRLLGVKTGDLLADGGAERGWIVVLDSEALGAETATGLTVSGVEEVQSVSDENVETDATTDNPLLQGIVRSEGGFLVWLDPQKMVG